MKPLETEPTVILLPNPKTTHFLLRLFPHSLLLVGVLVLFLLLVGQGAPHLSQLLPDAAERQLGIVLLDLGAVLLAEEHEASQRLLLLAAPCLLGLGGVLWLRVRLG